MSNQVSNELPGAFRRIRLELAREKDHPDGDDGVGYTLLAPLTADGHLDPDLARLFKKDCMVIRFRHGEEAEEGYLKRGPAGVWAFHYDFEDGGEDDDPAYRLGQHRFVVGDYVTIKEDKGAHTYRVSRVDPV